MAPEDPVDTIEALRNRLNAPHDGARFAKAFSERYFAVAFGITPKSELDQLVFDALVSIGAIDPDGPVYPVARALNITPAKARSLIFQHQLRHDVKDLDQKVLETLARARFSIEEKRLNFGVESPLVRAVIDARLKKIGVFSDISLSGEILRIPASQLGEFVSAFLTGEKAKALSARLKKAGSDRSLTEGLNEFGKAVARDAFVDVVKDGGKSAMEKSQDLIRELFSGLAQGDGAGGGGEFSESFLQVFNAG